MAQLLHNVYHYYQFRRTLIWCLLGMQQYGQKPYCVLLFEILQYIAILQYLELDWQKDRLYTVRKAHPMKCKAYTLGAWPQEISLDCMGNFC